MSLSVVLWFFVVALVVAAGGSGCVVVVIAADALALLWWLLFPFHVLHCLFCCFGHCSDFYQMAIHGVVDVVAVFVIRRDWYFYLREYMT